MPDWRMVADQLTAALALQHPPVAMAWSAAPPDGVAPYGDRYPDPAPDGRTGAVPAGCVFWTRSEGRTFTTTAADHANCSVGSVTHGFRTWEDVVANGDVAALFDSGWVAPDDVPAIPVVAGPVGAISYGPLGDLPVDPDVVLVRLNAEQAMLLQDAVPDLRVEGKPQCHIVALAKESGHVALSLGCTLSRVRMELEPMEMTCALPAHRLESVVARLAAEVLPPNIAVRDYAAEDAARFP